MLTDQKAAGTPAETTHHAPSPDALDQLICYFEGQFVPMADAKVSIMTHAFMYGTATFEGIRAYWNEEQGVLYGLKLREHVERLRQSCRILLMRDVPSVDELTGLIVETVRRNGVPPGRLHPPVVLQVDPGHRRPAARPRQRALRHRPAVRELHRHRRRRPDHDLVLAAQRRRGAAGSRQDRRRLREHGVPEDRGRAQRLRRGARPHRRRPRQRGVGGEPVRRPRRRRAHPARQRRPARRRHPQGDHGDPRQRGDPRRGALDRPLRALRGGRGPAVRDRRPGVARWSRSTTGPSGPASIGPIARIISERYFDAVRGRLPEYAHWLTPIK